MITLELVKNHPQTMIFMEMADRNLAAMGYTEHGARHAKLVAKMTSYILEKLGYDQKTMVLGSIAGYMHDIGNAINRNDHGISSAFLAYQILKDLKTDYHDIARIISAAGNHDEERGEPVNDISAAVVIADKADVHSSRVRSTKEIDFDIHDRVNYAVKKSRLQVNPKLKTITLEISIDNHISKVMEYFEIFLTRMMASQKAAKLLDCEFKLVINKTKLL
jgi:metal-dependent HD superfamily phosphatase/phosphodiesterase